MNYVTAQFQRTLEAALDPRIYWTPPSHGLFSAQSPNILQSQIQITAQATLCEQTADTCVLAYSDFALHTHRHRFPLFHLTRKNCIFSYHQNQLTTIQIDAELLPFLLQPAHLSLDRDIADPLTHRINLITICSAKFTADQKKIAHLLIHSIQRQAETIRKTPATQKHVLTLLDFLIQSIENQATTTMEQQRRAHIQDIQQAIQKERKPHQIDRFWYRAMLVCLIGAALSTVLMGLVPMSMMFPATAPIFFVLFAAIFMVEVFKKPNHFLKDVFYSIVPNQILDFFSPLHQLCHRVESLSDSLKKTPSDIGPPLVLPRPLRHTAPRSGLPGPPPFLNRMFSIFRTQTDPSPPSPPLTQQAPDPARAPQGSPPALR
jgi:hypothetical protein